ncbi:hypothetical protein L6164_010089 [Bauhinia variegata]|uniref:Uncharacterized protein n=1 Tax=Bauhinia variegata TaxID=167791 RepID=A0ACB9PM58_BAUVA|nr:hypothetical protein L6164_010089 [Bauhinia variegata]
MSSHFSTTHQHHHYLLLLPSLSPSYSTKHLVHLPPSSSSSSSFSNSFVGAGPYQGKDKPESFDFRLRCSAISKPRTQECQEMFQGALPTLNWHEIVEDDTDDDHVEETVKVSSTNEIEKRVDAIKSMLDSMEDGEISISAYDTAWVALIEDVHGSGAPQFPSSLEWIAKNQLPDGSWGDSQVFSAHDRIINALACVVALKSWNIYPEKCDKGMAFFRENISKLENENDEHMPIGFEVAFPSLLEIARTLKIEVPDESPVLKDIFAKRSVKLTRIPKEVMHKVPTTLLHSLEGMSGLDWKQLLKLQSQDGSFLFSPSSTAFALMQTKDQNCLKYLNKAVTKFNGGVPNVYPVDLFEHIWVVDRLQRLGISRYFELEIKECLNYVYKHWTEKGICWARNSVVQDIDDTAMGFRLLRLHGYQVSASVFKHFEREGEFFCFAGQSNQAVTGMFNLHRASQLVFPGEKILEDAKHFSAKFLRKKRAANQLIDKWIIMKNLPQEVAYALDVPWYANLPRVETRFYIEQYGGEDDVWIGKTLYRMPYVNNNIYLELAKLDYDNCQEVHLREWDRIQQWYSECRLGEFGLSRSDVLLAYFLAAASIFEAERCQERLAWAKTTALVHTITSSITDREMRKAFLNRFNNCIDGRDYTFGWRLNKKKTGQGLLGALVGTIDQLSWDILVSHGHEIGYDVHQAWKNWLSSWASGGDRWQGEAELLVQTINLSAGHLLSEELVFNSQYQQLLRLTNRLCSRLRCHQKDKAHVNGSGDINTYSITNSAAESEMQELAQLVLQKSSDGIDSNIKNTLLTVAKSFYYAAFFDSRTINFHIAKVLFEKVI